MILSNKQVEAIKFAISLIDNKAYMGQQHYKKTLEELLVHSYSDLSEPDAVETRSTYVDWDERETEMAIATLTREPSPEVQEIYDKLAKLYLK